MITKVNMNNRNCEKINPPSYFSLIFDLITNHLNDIRKINHFYKDHPTKIL